LGYLDKALKIDSENSQTIRMLGQVNQLQGDLDKSLEYYLEAVKVDPKDLWAIKGAVGSALEAGNINTSREVLDVAISELPNEPEIYELVSRVAQSAGDTKMAIEAMEFAKSLSRN